MLAFAAKHDVPASRMVFSQRCVHQEYRQRLTLADLYLDTHPYNAGSTARDVLDARLPMLTLSGRTFISRMAGSMLRAAGLKELVTQSMAEYEKLLVSIGSDTSKLLSLKQKLELSSANWAQAPRQLVRSMERGLHEMLRHLET